MGRIPWPDTTCLTPKQQQALKTKCMMSIRIANMHEHNTRIYLCMDSNGKVIWKNTCDGAIKLLSGSAQFNMHMKKAVEKLKDLPSESEVCINEIKET